MITVLDATLWPREFNEHVHRYISAEHPDAHFIQMQVDSRDPDPPVLDPELVALNRAVGHPDDLMLVPGYYLFLGGHPAGYSTAFPDDTEGIARELVDLVWNMGTVWWARRKGDSEMLDNAQDELFGTVGRTVSRAFNPTIAQWSEDQGTDLLRRGFRKSQRARRVALDRELARALDVLGASPDDSYDQVKRKRRDRLRQWHPDNGGNHAASHELTVTVNRSWEYICIRKGWQP